jgi:hypothetical protein
MTKPTPALRKPRQHSTQRKNLQPKLAEIRRALGGVHHARFIDPEIPYHCLLRTVRGLFLLRPDRAGQAEKLIAGAMKRALELYPDVEVFNDAWLSNHAHLLLKGPPEQLPLFIGFVKREVSKRLGSVFGWRDGMFRRGYEPTALPSVQSQIKAQAYVLSQGVKENLVDRPQQWPGAHSAKELSTGTPRNGIWFDGTGYARAVDQYRSRVSGGKPPARKHFEHTTQFHFDRLPALKHLSAEEYQAHINAEIEKIVSAAADQRRVTGKRVLGRRAACEVSRLTRSELPKPPSYEKRRKMIIWDDPRCPEACAYLERYWRFQDSYRQASERFRDGHLNAAFPPGAFRPSSFALAAAA